MSIDANEVYKLIQAQAVKEPPEQQKLRKRIHDYVNARFWIWGGREDYPYEIDYFQQFNPGPYTKTELTKKVMVGIINDYLFDRDRILTEDIFKLKKNDLFLGFFSFEDTYPTGACGRETSFYELDEWCVDRVSRCMTDEEIRLQEDAKVIRKIEINAKYLHEEWEETLQLRKYKDAPVYVAFSNKQLYFLCEKECYVAKNDLKDFLRRNDIKNKTNKKVPKVIITSVNVIARNWRKNWKNYAENNFEDVPWRVESGVNFFHKRKKILVSLEQLKSLEEEINNGLEEN